MAGEEVALIVLLACGLLAALLWTSLAKDDVGFRARQRRQLAGLQGRTTDWLYYEALLWDPNTKKMKEQASPSAASTPSERALNAVAAREAFRRRTTVAQGLDHLKDRVESPLLQAFLQGKMRRAQRIHWRNRYRGPPALFMAWYYGIALVRYGRRHLYLDTLSAALREIRDQ